MNALDLYKIVVMGNMHKLWSCVLNALGVTVQCCHETGWFRSRPMMRHWNLAGIKCTKSWVNSGGKCFSAKTWEEEGGQRVDQTAGFRSYAGLEEFLRDYSRLIASYYPLSRDSHDCVWLYLAGLYGKWATDSRYFRALGDLVPRIADEGGGSRETLLRSADAAVLRGYPERWMRAEVAGVLYPRVQP